jgi:hypothetical protein
VREAERAAPSRPFRKESTPLYATPAARSADKRTRVAETPQRALFRTAGLRRRAKVEVRIEESCAMSKPFFLSNHPCPECYGNFVWCARECPHCHHRPTLQQRFDLAPPYLKFVVFGVTGATVMLAGALLLQLIGLGA